MRGDADIRRALRDRLTIRRRVVLDPRWISAEHHRDVPESERPAEPVCIDETSADLDTVAWALEQVATLKNVTAEDFAFVREYLVYALAKLGATEAQTAEYLAALGALEYRRNLEQIAAHVELEQRRDWLHLSPTISADQPRSPADTVTIASMALDARALIHAVMILGVPEASAIERLTALRASSARVEQLNRDIGDALLHALDIRGNRGRRITLRRADELLARFAHWYPIACAITCTIRVLRGPRRKDERGRRERDVDAREWGRRVARAQTRATTAGEYARGILQCVPRRQPTTHATDRRMVWPVIQELVLEADTHDHGPAERAGRGAAWGPLDTPSQLAYRLIAHEANTRAPGASETANTIKVALMRRQDAMSAIVAREAARDARALKHTRAAYAKHARRDAQGGRAAIEHRWRARAEARAK